MSKDSKRTIGSFSTLLPQEYQQIVYDWNQTATSFPQAKTLYQLFAEQVKKTPNNTAVVCVDTMLSYQSLENTVNALAIQLYDAGVCSGSKVIFLLDRNVDYLCSMLAVWKLGAAFVPLNLDAPEERNDAIISQVAPVLVLTNKKLQSYIQRPKSVSPAVDYLVTPTDLAYIIFTSGSTGRPKGAMIQQVGAVNHLFAKINTFNLTEQDNIAQTATQTFDVSIWQFMAALVVGGRVTILTGDDAWAPSKLLSQIDVQKITLLESVPSHLSVVLDELKSNYSLYSLSSLRYLMMNGEGLPIHDCKQWLAYYPQVLMANVYGPTECSDDVTHFVFDKVDDVWQPYVPIGKPIQNTQLYIVDQQLNPVPIGVRGELCVAGIGVGLGYLGLESQTEAVFIANPFSTDASNARLYKTGDLARWTDDGLIEYVGRIDFQIKINGQRVELGEIEHVLSDCPEIRQSVVVVYENRLVAYYVSESTTTDINLRDYLTKQLPEHMIPSVFIAMESFPLTSNGKLDRHALPTPEFTVEPDSYIAPRNELEITIATTWQAVLGLERIGIQDDFFRLGGDSIQSIQVSARLQREGIDCRVRDIFTCRTIAKLSEVLKRTNQTNAEQAHLTGSFGLLPIQQWFFEKQFPYPHHWNQSFLVRVPLLSLERLTALLPQLVAHHDVLRLQFNKNQQQTYADHIVIPAIKTLDIQSSSAAEIEQLLTNWQSDFNFEQGPLWRMGYLTGYADNSARLYFALHHLIVDGVSWRILMDDVNRLYEGSSLGNKSSSYRQWVQAVADYPAQHPDELSYWEAQRIALAEIRPLSEKEYTTSCVLDKDATRQLLEVANRAYHTEINDLLLTALAYTLRDWLGHNATSITMEGHGREDIDVSLDVARTLGWFTVIYPVKLEVKESLADSIQHIKESLRLIPNKGIGFGAYQQQLAMPLSDITFNYLGQFDSSTGFWQLSQESSGHSSHVKNNEAHRLSMNGLVIDGQLQFNIATYTSEADSQLIQAAFQAHLQAIIEHCIYQTPRYTPSDFKTVKLSGKLLDKLQANDSYIEAIYHANSLQQGFVYYVLSQPEDDAYRVQLLLDYHNTMNVEAYQQAWALAIQTYPTLRTYFNWEETIIQIVTQKGNLDFTLHNISDAKDKDSAIQVIQQVDRNKAFNLQKPTLLRIHLIKHHDTRYTLLQSIHHSITDGWSGPILLDTVHANYQLLIQGITPTNFFDTAYLSAQDYIAHNKERANKYWQTQLADIEHANDLNVFLNKLTNLDEARTVLVPGEVSLHLEGEVFQSIKDLIAQEGLTFHIVCQFVWHKLIQVYTQDRHTIVGTTHSGRAIPVNGIEKSVGLYINTVPLILEWDGPKTVLEQLRLIESHVTALNEYGFVDLASLQKEGRRLFHSLFVFENYPMDSFVKKEQANALQFDLRGAIEKLDYPLGLLIFETSKGLEIVFKYDGTYLEKYTVERLLLQFRYIFEQLNGKRNEVHYAINLLSPLEYQQVVYDWNKTDLDFPKDKMIHQLFEEQVQKTPDHIAVVFEEDELTYKELNEEANQLARYIRKQYKNDLKPDTLIALCIDRSLEMIIAILGVLKAGAAYVPVDPNYPKERIDYILQDTQAKLILDNTLKTKFYRNKLKNNLTSINGPHDLAYVIYTSGTTGSSKGVMQLHSNVMRLFTSTQEYFSFNASDVWLLYHAYVFDFSVWEIWGALIYGGKLVIPSDDDRKDMQRLCQLCIKHNVSVLNQTPSAFHVFSEHVMNHLSSILALRYVIFGGEALQSARLSKWWEVMGDESPTLVNMYGITETTVHVTYKRLSATEAGTSIGKPLGDLATYVLDTNLSPLPIGAIGELYIGGAGLARGYLNQPALTKERFIENPFATAEDKKKSYTRLYKTGDLVRWLPDGNLEYISRNDFQVKIRGYRIELGEVEGVLSGHPDVKQVSVIAHDNKLIAYYVGHAKTNLSDYLSSKLPEYMIPSAFIAMDSFPLTINGKLDRKALPLPDFTQNQNQYIAPRDEIEFIVCQIWQQALSIPQVGIDDDFFRLGGHSILAIQVTHKISRVIKRNVLVVDIFKHRTIAKLCAVLKGHAALQNIQPVQENPSPLSYAQERLWFIEQYEDGTNAYHVSMLLRRDDNLLESLQRVIQRHAILRTRFVIDDNGRVLQKVHNEPLPIEENINPDEFIHRIFDLTTGHPLRAGLYEDYLLMVFHHIAFDAWSVAILQKELQNPGLPPLEIQYKDFAVWQRNLIESRKDELLTYWKDKLADITPLQMPTDYSRPANIDYTGAFVAFTLPNELKAMSAEYNVTHYATFLAGLAITLSRYAGQNDLTIGTPVTNRQHPQLEHLIGFFVNTLVLRIQLNPSHTLSQCISQIQNDVIDAQLYQDMPFEKLVDELNVERDTSRHSLFQVMYDVQYGDDEEALNEESDGLLDYRAAKFDLSITLHITPHHIKGSIDYATSLFKAGTIDRFITHYKQILSAMVAQEDAPIGTYSILTPAEYQQILYEWNNTDQDYPKDKMIHQLFEDQVKKTPNNIAVIFEDQQLTYRELNHASNQLARFIRKQYSEEILKPDTLIGLCLDRSLEMIIGILGILKVGMAYVPIDSDYPIERICYMLKDTKTVLLLTQTHLLNALKPAISAGIQCIALDDKPYQYEKTNNLQVYSQPTDLAYVIYTSGTTGLPKGVMIEHKSVVNLAFGARRHYTLLSEHEKIAQICSFTFDSSCLDYPLALFNGYELHILSERVRADTNLIAHYIAEQEITYIDMPTILYGLFEKEHISQLSTLKYLAVGGEKLSYAIDNAGLNYILINAYGPTESTVNACVVLYAGHEQDQVAEHNNIGRAIDNVHLYVLDTLYNPVLIGVIGELYIGGAGLARGYLNQLALTQERFIDNPFATDADRQKGYTRLYKTGDLVCWLPDGNLEYIGRNDFQVKIRGFRVELAEVERVLLHYPEIKQSVVIAQDNRLIAYVVCKKMFSDVGLRDYLSKQLPEYMIPSAFVAMESFPLASNGKLDRKALPEPEFTTSQESYIAPKDEIETIVCTIWQNVLNVLQVGVADDFFQLGGHSILAIQVAHQMSRILNSQVLVADIFKYRTIRKLYSVLRGSEALQFIPLHQQQLSSLSFAQERLWFIEQYEGGSDAYHIPMVFDINESTDETKLIEALQQVITRHAILRTFFVLNEKGQYLQAVHNESLAIETSVEPSEFIHRIFDLTQGHPLRAGFYVHNNKRYLLIIFHHIVFDEWSGVIFSRELWAYYNNTPLKPLEIQYKDFAVWQRCMLESRLESLLAYWRNKLQGITPLNMPTDHPRPINVDYKGASHYFELPNDLVVSLNQLTKDQNVTSYTTLLTGLALTLSRYTGQTDLVIGTPVANRQHPQLADLIGFFVNTLVLRLQLDPSHHLDQCMALIQNDLIEAQLYQELPFEKLVDGLNVERDTSRHPIFQIMYEVQYADEDEDGGEDVIFDYEIAKFDLIVFLQVTPNQIKGSIQYATGLFESGTILCFITHYENLLKSMVQYKNQPISTYPVLTSQEYQQIIYGWNQTEKAYSQDQTISQLFETQVKKTPQNKAVICKDVMLSYQELYNTVEVLAYQLHKEGIGSGSVAVLLLDRNIDYLCGMLAIWKLGAAFVPLSPHTLEERNTEILAQVNPALVLTKAKIEFYINNASPIVREQYYAVNPPDLAYIIFTSGSTGKPKGAMIQQAGAVNHLFAKIRDFDITERDNIAQTATQTFDVSIWQFMAALLVGGRVTILTEDDAWVPSKLLSHVDAQGITILESVPSHLPIVLDEIKNNQNQYALTSLRYLIMNGEGLPVYDCKQWLAYYPAVSMANAYGPTECSDDVTHFIFHEIDEGWRTYVPIGKPIQNTQLYIVDSELNPVPIRAWGELCVAGVGVGLGYLGLENKTQVAFTTNPFSNGTSNTRLYKTGDLARWRNDGIIECMGRIDFQVKINGQRVELGEIEYALSSHPDISQSVVVVHSNRLVAYYVSQSEITETSFREHLKKRLPEHMIPNRFIVMESLPLTSNGKLDRKALPEPTFAVALDTYVAPRDEIETSICSLWQELLNIPQVGIEDDFFRLGGHSILALQVTHQMSRALNCQVLIADIFKYRTIARLCPLLRNNETLQAIPSVQGEQSVLSFAQERLWFIEQYEAGSDAYHIPMVFRLNQGLDEAKLIEALQQVIKRHAILRTYFILNENGQYLQVAHNEPLSIESSIEPHEFIHRIFDLTHGHPLRAGIYFNNNERHLLLVFHHITFDEWSGFIFNRELWAYYNDTPPKPLEIQYRDFAAWQRCMLEPQLESLMTYWRNKLQGITPLNMPTDHPRPINIDYKGASHYFELPKDLVASLNELTKAQNVTSYTTMLTGLALTLSRYTGQMDLVIGTPIANRQHPQLVDLIGFFVNTLVLRFQLDPSHNLSQCMMQIQNDLIEAQLYQDLPFEKLVDGLNIERDTSRHPIFQVRYVVQYANEDEDEDEDGPEDVSFDYQVAKFDLLIFLRITPNQIRGSIEYATSLFDAETIRCLATHYECILKAMVEYKEQAISSYSILTPQEYQRIIYDWNTTDGVYSKDKTIHQLFEEQVIRTPHHVAVVFGDQQLTYKELNEEANQLANYIRKQYNNDLKPDMLIALCMDRSLEMVTAILGVFKAGAAYVPIDPNYPKERIDYILQDSQAKLVLNNTLKDKPYRHELKKNVTAISGPQDLAYVIYTSGTTGKPKGVMVEHGEFIFYQLSFNKLVSNSAPIVSAFTLSYCFDASLPTLFSSLVSGGKVVVTKDLLQMSSKDYFRELSRQGVNTLRLTPSMLAGVVDELLECKEELAIVLGGETYDVNIVNRIAGQKNIALYNQYGPSECVVGSSVKRLSNDTKTQIIGNPYPGKLVYVLDNNCNPIPIGAIGELFIGGAGLARGYLNQPGLTKERFIPNPFATDADLQKGYTRLYKTGDLVRRLRDGQLEYLGRNDFQVKIRGYRIELSEIEAALRQYNDVSEATVQIYKDAGGSKLVAYIVANEFTPTPTELNEFLAEKLPNYMIPAIYLFLDSMPLTPNGKLDRKALPEPEFAADAESYTAPRNTLESTIATIWQAVLGIERIGIYDDFFRLGGDSIQSIQVSARLQREEINCRVKDIFIYRTIAKLSEAFNTIQQSKAEQGLLTGSFDLLPIQQWFFARELKCPNHWNQSFLVRVPELSLERLESLLPALVAHHDALRLRFNEKLQTYVEQIELPAINTLDIQGYSEEVLETILTDWQSDFNLSTGPLWRMGYLKGYADKSARLYFALHHLIVDGVSWRILIDDIKRLYEGASLGTKSSSYRQWVQAVSTYPSQHPEELVYWQAQNTEQVQALKLGKKAYYTSCVLDKAATSQLLSAANAAYHTEINDLLLTALAYTLNDWLKTPATSITLEGHGREDIDDSVDVSRTLGWFTTMYPVKLAIKESIAESIQHIKESLRLIPNKGIGFGAYNKQLSMPLPDITFNYLGQFDNATGLWQLESGSSGRSSHVKNSEAYLLSMNGLVIDGQLQFDIATYMSEADSQLIQAAFQAHLQAIIEHCIHQTPRYTPSDFKTVKLSRKLLDKLQANDAHIDAIYHANSLQQGFIYHALSQPDDDAYRVQLLLDYQNGLNVEAYQQAWALAIQTYPILRTYFNWDEAVIQIITQKGKLDFTLHDISDAEDKDSAIQVIQQADRNQAFDLQKPTLLRIHLIKHHDTYYTLLQNMHHSVTDGWSGPILLNTVHANYQLLIQGITPSYALDTAYLSTQDYIAHNKERANKYWQTRLADIEHANDLNVFLNKPTNLDEARTVLVPGEVSLHLEGEVFQSIKDLITQEGLTLHIVCQFVWHKLIQVYTQDRHSIVGTTQSGRAIPVSGIEKSVGLYINTVPLILEWDNTKTVLEQLRLIESRVTELNEYGFVDLASLQKEGRRLFHSLFVFENYPVDSVAEEEQANALQLHFREAIEKFDYPFGLIVYEIPKGLNVTFKYDSSSLDDAKAPRLLEQFQQIFAQLNERRNQLHHTISLLNSDEYQQIVYDWNKTSIDFPTAKTIHQLFEEQVERTPNRIALVYKNQQLTYKALNEEANQLAHYIRKKYNGDLKPDTLIALCMSRSLEMIIAILGVLKSGAAYVPIDPTYPKERIDYILQDTQATLVLDNALKEKPYCNEFKTNLLPISGPYDLAYVIYTSGTTGRPKGVMIEHASFSRFIDSFIRLDAIHALCQDLFSTLALTSYIFDIFGLEYGMTLIKGGMLVLSDLEHAAQDFDKHSIQLIQQTPSVWRELLNRIPPNSLEKKVCLIGGEPIDIPVMLNLIQQNAIVLNVYGPTETTIWSTYFECNEIAGRTIGKAFLDEQLYVLDVNLAPLPIGVVGELYIGGAGLSRGYFNQPELTKERFISNPFATKADLQQGYNRLYKTGDLVRWLLDGNLEYMGRNDFQVKIRGYRIELGEIEHALLSHADIKKCVVLAKNKETASGQTHYLVAYYVSEVPITEVVFRDYLGSRLPEYMIPSSFMALASLPLTMNGKLDRKALPEPKYVVSQNKYVPPRDELESISCTIWQDILNIPQAGIDDDFFQLGGHSILAIQVTHKMSCILDRQIVVADVFKYRTIAKLCSILRDSQMLKAIPVIQEQPSLLSFAQERLWFIEKYEGGTDAYHIPMVFEIDDDIDEIKLIEALQSVIKRHAVLRTYFVLDHDGQYLQMTHNERLPIEEMIESNEFIHRIFDLHQGHPLRAGFYCHGNKRHLLVIFHHIVFDEWSSSIFNQELWAYYNEEPLKPLEIQYKDFAIWQRSCLELRFDDLITYWKNKLQDIVSLDMPTDYPRPINMDYKGANHDFELSSDLVGSLKELTKLYNVTSYTMILTGLALTLSRYTGQQDLVIGTPVANRQHPQLAHLIGFFVNTLVLRIQLESTQTLEQCVNQIQNNLIEAQRYQDLPFEKLVDSLKIERDTSRHPIFQLMYEVQYTDEDDFNVEDNDNSVNYQVAKFDLMFFLRITPHRIMGEIQYATSLFKRETIQRFIIHFENILKAMVQYKQDPISNYPILTPEEYQKIVYDWNKTELDFPKDKTIYHLFEEQAKKTPHNLAVVCQDISLSYQDLYRAVNILAAQLYENQVNRGSLVVFLLERNIDYLCSMLAVWKLGAAFIPLNPNAPEERNNDIILKIDPVLVLTRQILCTYSKTDNNALLRPYLTESSDLAYIIFTSGSTGNPKGAMIQHRGAVNHLCAKIREFNFTDRDNIAQTATQTFDVSIWQFMAALLVGGRVTILTEDDAWLPNKLFSHIDTQKITILESVPSHFTVLLDEIRNHRNKYSLSSLRYLIMNGEGLPVGDCEQWFTYYPNIWMANAYGPTECSDDVAHLIFNKIEESWRTYVPIGKPIQNTQLYIVDPQLNFVPIGVWGELCVSGVGVGPGYLGLDHKTQEVFISNPFSTLLSDTRLYKTGDFTRWTEDGIIEYLGRVDLQVKINGQRVELGEIEHALAIYPDVQQAVVTTYDNRLVAYYISQVTILKESLVEHLTKQLPEYMIPIVFIALPSLPLMPNGKLDRKALPEPNFDVDQNNYIAPRDELESIVCNIWQKSLNIPQVSVEDDFFRLGGHSIMALQVTHKMSGALNFQVLVADIFKQRTVRKLCAKVRGSESLKAIPVIQSPASLLSFAQERLWFIEQYEGGSNAYHIPNVFQLDDDINEVKLVDALQKVIERHDILRTYFVLDENGQYLQMIHNESLLIEEGIEPNEFIYRIFDLTQGHPLRAGFYHHNDKRYLLIVFHHIAFDEWSGFIFDQELWAYYNNQPLEPLPIQYKDFAVWQRDFLATRLDSLMTYWKNKLQHIIPLNFPTDYSRPANFDYKGASVLFSLPQDLTIALKELTKTYNVTTYTTLLTGLALTLSRYTGQTDITIGTSIANRQHPQLANLIGFFVNTLVLRLQLDSSHTLIQCISQIQDTLTEAQLHQDLPFEKLMDGLKMERDASRHPIFQIKYVVQYADVDDEDNVNDTSDPDDFNYSVAKFDLMILLRITPNQIKGSIHYATSIFKKETMERFIDDYKNSLLMMVN